MAKRTRINRPYPTHTLQDVLPIAETIQESNGGRPVRTSMLAQSLGTSTKSSMLVQKLNASAKYGLTNGAHSSEMIELTDMGEMLTAPGSPHERAEALRRAATHPDIFAGFYEIYSGKRMPSDVYAANTLNRELGIRRELTDECMQILRLNGLFAGIITDVDGVSSMSGALRQRRQMRLRRRQRRQRIPQRRLRETPKIHKTLRMGLCRAWQLSVLSVLWETAAPRR